MQSDLTADRDKPVYCVAPCNSRVPLSALLHYGPFLEGAHVHANCGAVVDAGNGRAIREGGGGAGS